jgi:hypothetical protein
LQMAKKWSGRFMRRAMRVSFSRGLRGRFKDKLKVMRVCDIKVRARFSMSSSLWQKIECALSGGQSAFGNPIKKAENLIPTLVPFPT